MFVLVYLTTHKTFSGPLYILCPRLTQTSCVLFLELSSFLYSDVLLPPLPLHAHTPLSMYAPPPPSFFPGAISSPQNPVIAMKVKKKTTTGLSTNSVQTIQNDSTTFLLSKQRQKLSILIEPCCGRQRLVHSNSFCVLAHDIVSM